MTSCALEDFLASCISEASLLSSGGNVSIHYIPNSLTLGIDGARL